MGNIISSPSKERLDELRLDIEKYCSENSISGVIRVTVGGRIEYTQNIGYADFENKIEFDENSMFSLYSLSKPFCALGLLKLVDKGEVSLDSHPSVYVPEAAGFDSRVTVRMMLHHVSGLPDFEQETEFARKYAPGYASRIREHVSALSSCKNYFEPGTAALYANVNFILAALIIENVTGLPYSEYMKREIFEPLGMKNAVIDNERLQIPARVKGYDLENGTLTYVGKSDDWLLGAGDIVATVDDVYRLNVAIKTGSLISDGLWREVLTPSPHNSMGMGCTISDWFGKFRITHNGGHIGFRTIHIQLPDDDFDIIFLSNSGFGSARIDLCRRIHDAFYGGHDVAERKIEMDKGYAKK